MKKTTFALFALVVLISQPLIITASVGFDSVSVAEGAAPVVLAQEPGTRLTGSDLSNHIPIFINGTTDFGSQGWPGAGTAGSPYVISALNITYGIGDPCIWIINTDQYFVIRDCFTHQLSAEYAIHLENVTHGVIEYSTLESGYGGLLCLNANSTKVSDTLIETVTNYGLFVSHSESFEMADSSVNTTQSHAAYLEFSNLSSISGVIIDSSDPYIDLQILNSDYVSVTDTEFHIAAMDLYVYQCANFTGNGLVSLSAQVGIYLSQCNDSQIVNAEVVSQFDSLDIFQCRGLEVTNSKFSSPTYSGQVVYVTSSNAVMFDDVLVNSTLDTGMNVLSSNITILNSMFTNIGSEGLSLDNSQDAQIQGCTFEDIGYDALLMVDSNRTYISDCSFANAEYGVAAGFCDNVTVLLSDFNVATTGIDCETNYGWEVHNNTFHNSQYGMNIADGAFFDIWYNTFTGLDESGIKATNNGLLEVWENTFSDCGTAGMELHSCDSQYIRDNTVSNCQYAIALDGTINSTLNDNIISNCYDGFYLNGVVTSEFNRNGISACDVAGFDFQDVTYSSFTNNSLTDCGFLLLMEPLDPQEYNHSFSGNVVNGKPLYYAFNQTDLAINGNSFGQIIVANCTNVSITGGEYTQSSCGIQAMFSNNVQATDVGFTNNFLAAFALDCENFSLTDSQVAGTNDDSGIFIYECINVWLENTNFTGVGGIWFGEPSAILVDYFYNVTVSNCQFTNIAGAAMELSDGSFGQIDGCSVANATAGIYAGYAGQFNVTDNLIVWCQVGIYAYYCDGWIVTGNSVHDGMLGVYRGYSNDWYVGNNTIRWNSFGLENNGITTEGVMADNIIAANFQSNALDNSFNYWDDGVDTGNYWGDYSGSGVYSIPGGGGSQDRYPMQYVVTQPIINTPIDVWYAEGSTGNVITWLPIDNELRNWETKMDGVLWASGSWDFQNISVNIDGLAYGTHTIVITVWDVDQNTVTDTVVIHVYDDTPPVINSPPNQWLFVGGTGQTIDWKVSDLHPATYTLTVDGTEFTSGTWTSGTLAVNVDGINDVGQHTLVLTIYDIDGNSANDTVLVRVIDDNVSPTIQQPAAVTYVEGTTGNSIAWNANDEYPASFAVVSNGTTVASGSWGGSWIVLNVDGLAPGSYQYTLTVYDMSDNSATSAVNVTVLALHPTIPVGGIDWVLVAIVGAVAGGAVVVVALVYYLRKRR